MAVSWLPDSQRLAVVWSKGSESGVFSVFTLNPAEAVK